MPFPMYPRANPPFNTHQEQSNQSYGIEQPDGTRNIPKGRGQGEVPSKCLTDRTQERQPDGYKGEDKDFPRFQRPYKNVPGLDGAHNEGKAYATNWKQTARKPHHLTNAVSEAEVKRIDRLQSKAFGGHDPNSIIRVGNEIFTTPNADMVRIGKENREMKSKLLCKMCSGYDAVIVFIPCGHLVCCPGCDARLTIDKCIICEKIIERRICVQDEEYDT